MSLTLTYLKGGMLFTSGTGMVGEGVVRQLHQAGVRLVCTYQSKVEKAERLAEELNGAGRQFVCLFGLRAS